MTTSRLLLSTWHWHPSVLLGCATLVVAYAVALRFRWTPRVLSFGAGVLALVLALLSPLHELGDRYLFSAHMLQHLLLLLIAPPLLLLGLPPNVIERSLDRPLVGKFERVLGQPLLAWSIGLGTMGLWHLPGLYNAALRRQPVHILEHLCFLVSATLFWWPIFAPGMRSRLHALAAVLYLFGAMLVSGILGMILTFAEPGLYPAYLRPNDVLGILPLLWGDWGLTPPVDQQIGGLLMWVPGSLVYLAGIVGMLARWYGAPPDEHGNVAPERFREVGRRAQRRTTDVV